MFANGLSNDIVFIIVVLYLTEIYYVETTSRPNEFVIITLMAHFTDMD